MHYQMIGYNLYYNKGIEKNKTYFTTCTCLQKELIHNTASLPARREHKKV